MRVLYVEDETQDIDLLRRELARRDAPITLEVVTTIDQARKQLTTEASYDLALIDLHLPDGSGLELLTEIRKQSLPLATVILTGHGDEDSVVAAMKAGADDYVVKERKYLTKLITVMESAIKRFRAESARKKNRLKVLYVEHNVSDVDLTHRHFKRYAPHIELDAQHSAPDALKKLSSSNSNYDLILLDYRLPGMNALEMMKILVQELESDLPVVLVTGHGDEEIAIQALRLGAADYITKHPGYLFELPASLENAYHRVQLMREQEVLRRREEEFRALAENAPDIVARFDRNLRHVYINPVIEKYTGIPREKFINRTNEDLKMPAEQTKIWNIKLGEVFQSGRETEMFFDYLTLHGRKYFHSRIVPEHASEGTVKTVLAINRDITAVKEMEAALYQEKQKTEQMHLRALPDYLPKMPGLTLAATYIPAASLQGDYCNVIRRHNQLLLYLVDVDESRDDGVMQSLYVRKAIEDYLQAHSEDAPVSPALLLRYLQDRFQQDNQDGKNPLCVFIAAFETQPAAEKAGSYSPELLRYASTGFCAPPLLIKESDNPNGRPTLENLYLAMDNGTELQEHTVTVAPGSTFVFSTDGLFNQGQDRGSYELRLRELLNKQAHLPPELISDALEADFNAFYGDYPLQSDIAFIVVQVLKQEQSISFKVESEFKRIEDAKEKVSSLLTKELGQEPNLLHFHELLVNAMEHGNKRDGGKAVSIEFTVTDQYYKAIITDQGEGFNWRDKINREIDLESDSERGRGIIMTRMMTDYLGYNERGNRVTMINLLK